ncbi:MAG: hypothetical protein ACJA0G_000762 [Kangiellaceae bacterium]|jgi:hypothetical protein
MEAPIHSMTSLFQQLGLDGTLKGVNDFIDKNAPIPDKVKLHEADFWTQSQSLCLEEMVDEDADWAEIVDQLNILLR